MTLDATQIVSAEPSTLDVLGAEFGDARTLHGLAAQRARDPAKYPSVTRSLCGFTADVSLARHPRAEARFASSETFRLIAPIRGAIAASIDCGGGFRALRSRPFAFLPLAPGRAYQLRWQSRPQIITLTIDAQELGSLIADWGVQPDALYRRLHGADFASQFVHAVMQRLWDAALLQSALLIHQLLCTLAAELYTAAPTSERHSMRGGLAGWQTNRVLEYLESHLDQEVTLPELAQLVGLSPAHFCRAFKQSIGDSPMRYVAMRRMERAKQLLAETRLRVIEVAAACGYECPSQFASVFRRATGSTPSEWRRT